MPLFERIFRRLKAGPATERDGKTVRGSKKPAPTIRGAGTVGRYTAGFIQEFLDSDQANEHFLNYKKYLNQERPTFRFAIQLAEGTVKSDLGDESLKWVLSLYSAGNSDEFTKLYLAFQKSDLYRPHGYDDYPFTDYRRGVYLEAIRSGTMRVLAEYKSPAGGQTRQVRVSLADKTHCVHCGNAFTQLATGFSFGGDREQFAEALLHRRVGCEQCGVPTCFECSAGAADGQDRKGENVCPGCGATLTG